MKEKCSRDRKQHVQSLEITGSMTCQLHGACARQDSGRELAKEKRGWLIKNLAGETLDVRLYSKGETNN